MATAAYLDECVDVRLAPALAGRGIMVRTTTEAGMTGMDDERQLVYATAHQLVLLTHDGRDFRRLHRQFVGEGRQHGGILVAPTGDLSVLTLRSSMLLDWLGLLGDYSSRFFTWGDLQCQLTQGMKLAGYTDAEHRLALGRSG